MSDKKDTRSRNWASEIYPESAPDNWRDILRSFHVPCLVSPLHDKDCWTELDEQMNPDHVAGVLKKPHYHIEMCFDGKKSFDQVREIVDAIGGVGVIKLQSKSGYAAYLTHMNEPDKYHYDESEVECIGGISYNAIMASNDEFKDVCIGEMLDWCDENKVYAYSALLRYARHENPMWFHVLNHTSSKEMYQYLKSKGWEDGITKNQ